MSNSKKHLLVVEDDKGLQTQLRWAFEGFEVVIANDREEAIAHLRRVQPGVVLLDLGLPPDPGGVTEGLATLREILSLIPETKVIVVTGDNDRTNAVNAIASGAYDFYQKPVDAEILGLIVNRAYQVHELEIENRNLNQDRGYMPLAGIIASSPQMLETCRTIEKVAPADVTTLLLGASGTGKERIAQALHELSHRSSKKMIAINCAAIPENLLESELFGYEKGAFTGAAKTTPGKIEYAEGGTLFLDEIGDLPMGLQAKLLRFLQERVVERVGGRTEIPVDVRIICATHQHLDKLIQEGRFREDLYYRVSEITINIPPLKDRKGDALLLAKSFLNRFSQEMQSKAKGFTPDAIRAIENYEWPGNVRELESRVKRSTIMSDGAYITAQDLQLEESNKEDTPLNLKMVREEAERKAVLRAISHSDDNISDAANLLGVTRPTLYSLLEKLGLKNQA
ncbi:MAG: PEP-CTERM-box response regulator transcription factor [Halioglobus sp.]